MHGEDLIELYKNKTKGKASKSTKHHIQKRLNNKNVNLLKKKYRDKNLINPLYIIITPNNLAFLFPPRNTHIRRRLQKQRKETLLHPPHIPHKTHIKHIHTNKIK